MRGYLIKGSLCLHTEASRSIRKKMLNRAVNRSCVPFEGTSKLMCTPNLTPSRGGNHATHKHPGSGPGSSEVRAGTFTSHQPMLPVSIRSNASSRSSPVTPIRHRRRRKKSDSLSAPTIQLHASSCELLTRTPPPEPRAGVVGEFPGRNCVAGTKTEDRKAGDELWPNSMTSGECAYVH